MSGFDIDTIEKNTLAGLKDFQMATINRIDHLYRHGRNRVLVADEVGMGKTLIARGTIVKAARMRLEDKGKLLKVVYICSNQDIASQNIKKLDVTGKSAPKDDISTNRLSMQHLKISQQENSPEIRGSFIQLIPLTPETSFNLSTGAGNVDERALMHAILERIPEVRRHPDALSNLLEGNAHKAWANKKVNYQYEVNRCEYQTNRAYPRNIIQEIKASPDVLKALKKHLSEMEKGVKTTLTDYTLLSMLRVMFAKISVSMMKPNLVIMDEFQRFSYLLRSDDKSEMGILVSSFFKDSETRVLLLSATPYKLYSTPEEMEEDREANHYQEFLKVTDFLFQDKKDEFRKVWDGYSGALNELRNGDTAIIERKNGAEDALYQGVCRTERISVMESGDYTDDSSVKRAVSINGNDILSYLQMGQLLQDINSRDVFQVDYVKSSPYLMSFMKNYIIRNHIEEYFVQHPDQVRLADKNLLWLSRTKINSYSELPASNARLEKLKEAAFVGGSEKYLWVPPSKPYYPLQGAYKDSGGFSKILVFSSWEMVPRMIGAMISYEAERLTIGRLSKQMKNQDRNTQYFADKSKRFPAARLKFATSNGEATGISLFCLLYPSRTLARLFDPVDAVNRKLTLPQIEREIRREIDTRLKELEKKHGGAKQRGEDQRWYYLAPMLMDGQAYVDDWKSDVMNAYMFSTDEDETTEERGMKGFWANFDRLEEYVEDLGRLVLGKRPADLTETLVNMVLGSPAVCIYRSNGNDGQRATELAKVFVNNFNLPESTAIVDLAYGRCRDDNSHWQNVIRYCKDGCFQAMFDEYLHMLTDMVGMGAGRDDEVFREMKDSLRIRTSICNVDTYPAFKNRVLGQKDRSINMRCSYAVPFSKSVGETGRNRKESIRKAFNSPLRPFVLATTSVGQEGLDFHFYCRKIMHWNLPSNPVDLEQREGRINRYKCLAIRQNVAQVYGGIPFRENIWEEMFEAAKAEKQEGQSELVPFWCFGKNQAVKIERIIPMYPISKDRINYERVIKILSLYRLTLGQARQEDLLEYLFCEFKDTEELKGLFIDLSPYSRERTR